MRVFPLRSVNLSSWLTAEDYLVLSLPCFFFSFKCVWPVCLFVCLCLPYWQQEIIMISAHQQLIISQNIPHCHNIFKPYVWSKIHTATYIRHIHTYIWHTWIVIFVHTHTYTQVHSSADRWSSGKEREIWKVSKHLRISWQQFPVDLLDMKPVSTGKHLFAFSTQRELFIYYGLSWFTIAFPLMLHILFSSSFTVTKTELPYQSAIADCLFHSFRTGCGLTWPNVSTV